MHLSLVFLLVFGIPAVSAQEVDPAPIGPSDTEVLDDGSELDSEAVDAESAVENTGETEPESMIEETVGPWKPDPIGALWRSGALAGLGQFYNEKWIKGAVMMGCELFTVGSLIYYADLASDELNAGRGFDLPDDQRSPELDELAEVRDEHYRLYEDYRVRYETYLWLSVFIVVYSMLDAYVDAHLWDFEVEEELGGGGVKLNDDRKETVSLDLEPILCPEWGGGWRTGLELSLTF